MLKFFRIASICLLILWMVMIFCLSAEPAEISSGTSGRLITILVKIFNWKFDELPPEAQTEIIESFQFVNYGRLDVIIGKFLKDTPKEEAQQIIECLLLKMYDKHYLLLEQKENYHHLI